MQWPADGQVAVRARLEPANLPAAGRQAPRDGYVFHQQNPARVIENAILKAISGLL
jgi:hypothetical protein